MGTKAGQGRWIARRPECSRPCESDLRELAYGPGFKEDGKREIHLVSFLYFAKRRTPTSEWPPRFGRTRHPGLPFQLPAGLCHQPVSVSAPLIGMRWGRQARATVAEGASQVEAFLDSSGDGHPRWWSLSEKNARSTLARRRTGRSQRYRRVSIGRSGRT